jgi:hypothetical protein
MSLSNCNLTNTLAQSINLATGQIQNTALNVSSQNLVNASKSALKNSEPGSGVFREKQNSGSGPIENQTSHSERSLFDILNCEEKEVNLE